MRQLKITKSSLPNDYVRFQLNSREQTERIEKCPVCQSTIYDIYLIKYRVIDFFRKGFGACCHSCSVELLEICGQWKTSFLEVHHLDTEVDLELAKEIYEVHESKTEIPDEEYINFDGFMYFIGEHKWIELLERIRENDKIYTWKINGRHGLALVRDIHVVHIVQFKNH